MADVTYTQAELDAMFPKKGLARIGIVNGASVNQSLQGLNASTPTPMPQKLEVPDEIQKSNAEQSAAQSDAQWAKGLADLYAPVTQAEIDRRTRGANAANAIGNLGAVLSAFGNLAYTGQNAPSQTIPDFKEADTQSWEDRQRARNLQYANTQMQERARRLNERLQDERMQQQAAELALRQQQMQQSAQQYADQKEYRDRQLQFERDKFDYSKSQGMTPEQLEALNSAKIQQAEASAAASRASANSAYAASKRADEEMKAKIEGGYYDYKGTRGQRGTYTRGGAGKTDTLTDSNGDVYSINYNAIGNAGISQIYEQLNGPDLSGDYTIGNDASKRRDAQLEFIKSAMLVNPDAASVLKQYKGAVTPLGSAPTSYDGSAQAPWVSGQTQAPWTVKK